MIYRVTDRTFAREVLLSKEPVLVNFNADRCEPCRTISRTLEQFAGEMNGRVKVVTLDVDQNPATRVRYDIHGLPTLIIFVRGEIAGRRIGALMQTDDLKTWFDASVATSRKK
jgi:thioredoxin 1